MPEALPHYRTADAPAQVSSPHQQEILHELVGTALRGTPATVALDLGSGRGANLGALVSHADHVVAADVSLEAIRDSRTVHVAIADRLSFVLLPGRAVPFASSSFGLTVCTEVLEHVDDPAATARELERVTAPGGYLFISTPNYRNVMGLRKQWRDWRSGRHDFDPWDAHRGGFERFMTAPKLRRLFTQSEILDERGADYVFALGVRSARARRKLNKYLLLRPGRVAPLKDFGMQYYVLMQKR